MKMFMLCLLFMSSMCFAKTCTELESRTAAHDFYATIEQHNFFSVPAGEQLKPYVTPSLHELFYAAALAEKKEFIRSQGKEPPLFEGHLFSGVTEGYTNFHISHAVPGKNNAEIYVVLQYAQHLMPYYATKPGILEWKERVEVKAEGEKCLVNNIFYSLEHNNDHLVSVLKAITVAK
ncbi:MAG: hypothetical protein V4732_07835 [Pseudomonadota bacterium]